MLTHHSITTHNYYYIYCIWSPSLSVSCTPYMHVNMYCTHTKAHTYTYHLHHRYYTAREYQIPIHNHIQWTTQGRLHTTPDNTIRIHVYTCTCIYTPTHWHMISYTHTALHITTTTTYNNHQTMQVHCVRCKIIFCWRWPLTGDR